jgi:toxin CptA
MVALCAIGLLGAIAVISSEMPRVLAWPLAMGGAFHAAWLAHRESRRPRCELVWPMEGDPILDGHVLRRARLDWRGPLAFLRWRDDQGRLRHLAWWPDTLSTQARRELRLAAASRVSTRPAASMAP